MGKPNYHLQCEVNGSEHLGRVTVTLEADRTRLH